MSEAKYIAGPWSVDAHALGIWAPNLRGGETKIFDIRGWGYLTGHGHGALALSHDEAKEIQRATGMLGAAAPILLAQLRVAASHIEHMAAFITAQKSGYSFESLGEDMPGIRAAITRAAGEA